MLFSSVDAINEPLLDRSLATMEAMAAARSRTYYELFGVPPDCSFDDLRTAYRRLARERHPDVAAPKPGLGTMAELNEAWKVLSNEETRRRYDESVRVDVYQPGWAPFSPPQPPGGGHRRSGGASSPATPGERRAAWAAGVRAQIARLSRLAGRSATQTMLIRHPRGPRSDYEVVVDEIVRKLADDVEPRVRAARAAGAAPLDLGVAATLVGIRSVADGVRRAASLETTTALLIEAELLDRMWDILAHELPVQLAAGLGGNPHVARAIDSRASRS